MKIEKNEEIKAAIEVLTKAFIQEEREIVPRYPYVLVRKIPRGEILTKHNIILTQQQGKGPGKPIHEGVVIRTWEPTTGDERQAWVFEDEIRGRLKHFHLNSDAISKRPFTDIEVEELIVLLGRVRVSKVPQRRSELQPGDLVSFPQYAGFPANGDAIAEDNLWFIPDTSEADITKVGILGHFVFVDERNNQMKLLTETHQLLSKFDAETTLGILKEHYDLVPKKVKPRTRIG